MGSFFMFLLRGTDEIVYVVMHDHCVDTFPSGYALHSNQKVCTLTVLTRMVASSYMDKCKENAFVSALTVDDGLMLMMDAVNNGTAHWMKGC